MPKESKMYLQLMKEGMSGKRYNFSPILPIIKIVNNLDSKINL